MTEPLATYRYTLAWRDALAYERLPRSMPMLWQITLYIWLVIGVVLLVALPSEVVGEPNTSRFWLTGAAMIIVQYLIYRGLRALRRWDRARLRYPKPTAVELTEWPARLRVSEAGKPPTIVPFESIGALLPTTAYLFMAVGHDLVILPATAFEGTPGGMEGMVSRIDGYMREKHGEPAEIDAPAANP